MTEARPFIEARGLSKRYPGVVALDDIDISLNPGEVTALVGKNGAGKSTLIKILAAAVQPDEGELRVEGEPVRFHGPADANKLGLAFVHQELADVPALSVAENVLLSTGLSRRGPFVDWKRTRERAREALRDLDDAIDPAAELRSLSVAQQRVVMIARALAQDARLIVLDEPTAALTATETDHLHSVVRTLAKRGVGVLYVSHRLGEVFTLTSRTVVMRDGRIVDDRPTSEFDSDLLIKEITGRATVDETVMRSGRSAASVDREALLEAEGLSRETVVRDVSVQVRAGEVLGIAGLVGTGRTELLRLLVGADARTSGTIKVRGREVAMRSPSDAARNGVVLLPEDRRGQGTVIDMTIRENITLTDLPRYRRHARIPFPGRERETEEADRQVGALGIKVGSVEDPVSWLSGGNQQKVVLAKWLARGADVLIFDEPTAGVDVDGRRDVYAQIRALAEAGKGIIVVSSDFSEFAPLCDRVLVMSEGRLVGEFEAPDISEEALVAACYSA